MVWLYFCLTFPSLPQVHKYLGWSGVAAYLAITALALLLLKRLGTAKRIAERITDRQARWLTGMTLLLVLAASLAVYPSAQSGAYGPGSDSDDFLNIAVRQIIHGKRSLGEVALSGRAGVVWQHAEMKELEV